MKYLPNPKALDLFTPDELAQLTWVVNQSMKHNEAIDRELALLNRWKDETDKISTLTLIWRTFLLNFIQLKLLWRRHCLNTSDFQKLLNNYEQIARKRAKERGVEWVNEVLMPPEK